MTRVIDLLVRASGTSVREYSHERKKRPPLVVYCRLRGHRLPRYLHSQRFFAQDGRTGSALLDRSFRVHGLCIGRIADDRGLAAVRKAVSPAWFARVWYFRVRRLERLSDLRALADCH